MFCPSCHGFITESSLLKSRVKKWENTDIEYDARCPLCSVEIGRMSWGKLDVYPHLQGGMKEEAPEQEQAIIRPEPEPEKPFIDPPLPEEAPLETETEQEDPYGWSGSSDSMFPASQMSGHYCPHCGKDLPNDINLLPKRW